MDFNTGNLNFKNSGNRKRKAQSIQDMIGSGLDMETGSYKPPIRKSGYSGPYKPRTTGSNTWGSSPLPEKKIRGKNDSEGRMLGRTGNTGKIQLPEKSLDERMRRGTNAGDEYDPPRPVAKSRGYALEGIGRYVWIIYVSVLFVCMISAIIAFAVTGGSSGSGTHSAKKLDSKLRTVYDELNATPSSAGIINDLVTAYVTGVRYTGAEPSSKTNTDAGNDSPIQTANPDGTVATTNGPDSTVGSITSGAAMIIDSGNGTAGYTSATSHAELMTQLESALGAGDTAFVGSKLAYRDDYGELAGYPQSVVDHFTSYMASNASKRSEFIGIISSEAYSAVNGTAYVVELQPIQFVVNMGYDNTTVSVEGFGDQVLNAGQQATIKPLLPCMYTVTLSNEAWGVPVVKEVEANMSELTLNLNVT